MAVVIVVTTLWRDVRVSVFLAIFHYDYSHGTLVQDRRISKLEFHRRREVSVYNEGRKEKNLTLKYCEKYTRYRDFWNFLDFRTFRTLLENIVENSKDEKISRYDTRYFWITLSGLWFLF